MKNYKGLLVKILLGFDKQSIVITNHALIRLRQRQIETEEVIENIINPKRLQYAIKQETEYPGEEKYDCYFNYSKRLCHRYVLVIKNKVIVVTVVKINRRWQEIAEKRLKGTK